MRLSTVVYQHTQQLHPDCPADGTQIVYRVEAKDGWAVERPRPICSACGCEPVLVEVYTADRVSV